MKDPYVKMARAQGSPSRAIFKLEEIDSMAAKFINQKQKPNQRLKGIIQPGSVVLDVGAAPGGWSKFVAERIKSDGLLIAIDLLPLDERTVEAIDRNPDGPNFHFVQGDFTTKAVKEEIACILSSVSERNRNERGRGVSLVISDMAPNFSGDKMTDALQTINLCEDALMLASGPSCFDERYIPGLNVTEKEDGDGDGDGDGILERGGSFICKYFACGRENENDLMSAVKRNFNLVKVLKPKSSRKESAEMYLFASGYKGGIPVDIK